MNYMKHSGVKMIENNSVLNGKSWTIKIKKWFGWVQPPITECEDAHFYNKKQADDWFSLISGEKQNTHKLIKCV